RALSEALETRIFKVIRPGVFAPRHRTVAEYLAGRWIAGKAEDSHLATRSLGFLAPGQGGPPTALRGLFAWTASHLPPAKGAAWIDRDPLSLVVYGDASNFGSRELVRLLEALRHRFEVDPWGERSELVRKPWAVFAR